MGRAVVCMAVLSLSPEVVFICEPSPHLSGLGAAAPVVLRPRSEPSGRAGRTNPRTLITHRNVAGRPAARVAMDTTTTVSEAFAALRSGNIGGRHQLAALDTLCGLLDRAQSDEECAVLGSTARAVSGIQLLGRLLPQAAAWALEQPTDEAGVEDRLQLLRRLLFVLSNLCSQAVDPHCGEMLC